MSKRLTGSTVSSSVLQAAVLHAALGLPANEWAEVVHKFLLTNVGGFALNSLSVADFSSSSMTLDNFQISQISSVPEPSTFALAGLGLLGLGCVALRKEYRRA